MLPSRSLRATSIIFDFDGVLALNSEEANLQAARKTFYDLNAPLTIAEMERVVGRASREYVPEFCRVRGIEEPAEHDRLIQKLRAEYDAIWPTVIRIAPHAKKTLFELKRRGKQVVIATTNRRTVVERFFDLFLLHRFFDGFVGSDDTAIGGNKYAVALSRFGFSADQTVAVEDSAPGLAAAKSVGIPCIVIPTEHSKHQDFRQADMRLRSLKNLPARIL